MTLADAISKYAPTLIRIFSVLGVDPTLGCAIAHHESDWDPSARSKDPRDEARGGSRGLCQVSLSTARDLGWKGTPEALYDPSLSALLAARLLARNAGAVTADPTRLAQAYNGGVGHVLNGTVSADAKAYAAAVVALMPAYADLVRHVLAG